MESTATSPTPLSEQTCTSAAAMYQNTDCNSTQPTIISTYQTSRSEGSPVFGLPDTTSTLMAADTSWCEEETTDTWWQPSIEARYDPTSEPILLPGKENVFKQISETTSGKEQNQVTIDSGYFTYPSYMDQLTPTSKQTMVATMSPTSYVKTTSSSSNATSKNASNYGGTLELISGQPMDSTRWTNSSDKPLVLTGGTNLNLSHTDHLITADQPHQMTPSWTSMWTTPGEMSNSNLIMMMPATQVPESIQPMETTAMMTQDFPVMSVTSSLMKLSTSHITLGNQDGTMKKRKLSMNGDPYLQQQWTQQQQQTKPITIPTTHHQAQLHPNHMEHNFGMMQFTIPTEILDAKQDPAEALQIESRIMELLKHITTDELTSLLSAMESTGAELRHQKSPNEFNNHGNEEISTFQKLKQPSDHHCPMITMTVPLEKESITPMTMATHQDGDTRDNPMKSMAMTMMMTPLAATGIDWDIYVEEMEKFGGDSEENREEGVSNAVQMGDRSSRMEGEALELVNVVDESVGVEKGLREVGRKKWIYQRARNSYVCQKGENWRLKKKAAYDLEYADAQTLHKLLLEAKPDLQGTKIDCELAYEWGKAIREKPHVSRMATRIYGNHLCLKLLKIYLWYYRRKEDIGTDNLICRQLSRMTIREVEEENKRMLAIKFLHRRN